MAATCFHYRSRNMYGSPECKIMISGYLANLQQQPVKQHSMFAIFCESQCQERWVHGHVLSLVLMSCPPNPRSPARRDHSSHPAMLHSHEIARPSKLCTPQRSSSYLKPSACWFATCVPESLDIGHQTRTAPNTNTSPVTWCHQIYFTWTRSWTGWTYCIYTKCISTGT